MLAYVLVHHAGMPRSLSLSPFIEVYPRTPAPRRRPSTLDPQVPVSPL